MAYKEILFRMEGSIDTDQEGHPGSVIIECTANPVELMQCFLTAMKAYPQLRAAMQTAVMAYDTDFGRKL